MSAAQLASTLDQLIASSSTLKATLHSLSSAGEAHATACAAVSQRLSRSLQQVKATQEEGTSLRVTLKLLEEMEKASKAVEGGKLERAVAVLEGAGQRTFDVGSGAGHVDPHALASAVEQERRLAVSGRALDTLTRVVARAAKAMESEWRDWIAAGAGGTLFHGAHALALSDSTAKERERVALDEAKERLGLAHRIDGLVALCHAGAAAAAVGDAASGGSALSELARTAAEAAASAETVVARCLSFHSADCAERLTQDLQKAGRVAGAGSADTATLLEAAAEASSTAARAARSIASALSLLRAPSAPDAAPPPDDTQPAEDSAGDAAEVSDAVLELSSDTDQLMAQLRDIPTPTADDDGAAAGASGRAHALKALGSSMCALLDKELGLATSLVRAAHSAKGRRALAMLGEAGERFAAAAASQARAELSLQ